MNYSLQHLPWFAQVSTTINRLWQHQALPHAFCLQGRSGLGKHHQLHVLAQLLLCERPNQLQACGECQQCVLFKNQEHPDFLLIAPKDKTSLIGIAQIRNINEFVASTAYIASVRLVLIQPLEQMTRAAANALLKLLEEPPKNVHFLLGCASPSHLMPTTRSRIQFFNVQPPSLNDFMQWAESYSVTCAAQPTPEQLKQGYYLAQGGPLLAINFVLRHLKSDIDQLPAIIGAKRDLKQADLISDFQRLMDIMKQSVSVIQTHLSVFIGQLPLPDSLLLFELWLNARLNACAQQTSIHKTPVHSLWQGFQALQSLRETLLRSPQLNTAHLQRDLQRIWLKTLEPNL